MHGGEAEIEHLDRAVLPYLDVARLQIAMNDPLSMCGVERLGNLLRDGQRFVDRQRAGCELLGQC